MVSDIWSFGRGFITQHEAVEFCDAHGLLPYRLCGTGGQRVGIIPDSGMLGYLWLNPWTLWPGGWIVIPSLDDILSAISYSATCDMYAGPSMSQSEAERRGFHLVLYQSDTRRPPAEGFWNFGAASLLPS
jgi:hypothetical protein